MKYLTISYFKLREHYVKYPQIGFIFIKPNYVATLRISDFK